jgi:hypothetical protein
MKKLLLIITLFIAGIVAVNAAGPTEHGSLHIGENVIYCADNDCTISQVNGISYNASTNTLTLNNFDGTSYEELHVASMGDLNIEIKGTNTLAGGIVSYDNNEASNLNFIGNGTLNLTGLGISVYSGDISVDGPTINLNGNNDLFKGENIDISNSNITYEGSEVVIRPGGNVNITKSKITFNNCYRFIYTDEDITITDSVIKGTSKKDTIVAKYLDITGSEITAYSYGGWIITTDMTTNIVNSSITSIYNSETHDITDQNGDNYSKGISVGAHFNVDNSEIKINVNGEAMFVGLLNATNNSDIDVSGLGGILAYGDISLDSSKVKSRGYLYSMIAYNAIETNDSIIDIDRVSGDDFDRIDSLYKNGISPFIDVNIPGFIGIGYDMMGTGTKTKITGSYGIAEGGNLYSSCDPSDPNMCMHYVAENEIDGLYEVIIKAMNGDTLTDEEKGKMSQISTRVLIGDPNEKQELNEESETIIDIIKNVPKTGISTMISLFFGVQLLIVGGYLIINKTRKKTI